MDLNKILEALDANAKKEADSEELRQAEIMGQAYANGVISKASLFKSLKLGPGGNAEFNANGDIFIRGARGSHGPIGELMEVTPVRPAMWSSGIDYAPEHEAEVRIKATEHTLFGPHEDAKIKPTDTIMQLVHLLGEIREKEQAAADECPSRRPCRFLLERVRDSEISGVPVGVSQRCAHPVFDAKQLLDLLAVYAEILNTTERVCRGLALSSPEVMAALPAKKRLEFSADLDGISCLPDLINAFFADLDYLRERVAKRLDTLQQTHVLGASDDRWFTHDPTAKHVDAKKDGDKGDDSGPSEKSIRPGG